MIVYEDKYFRIVKDRNNFVLIRKNFPYDFHSHFKNLRGCQIVMGLFHKKLIPKQPYFKTSMQRITTKEEYAEFRYKKRKLSYRNKR